MRAGGGLRRLVLAAGLALAAVPAAADPFVACVQGQLSGMGFKPGAADGVMGRRTLSAWMEMKMRHESSFSSRLRNLPPLSRETAIHWCRELPVLETWLSAFQPSVRSPLVRASSDPAETLVRQAFASAKAFLKREYGVVLAGDLGIAAADDWRTLQKLARQVKAQTAASPSQSDAAIRTRCDGEQQVLGTSYRNWMFICWIKPQAMDDAWLAGARRWLGALMAHEYTHIVQAELGGARTYEQDVPTQLQQMGPLWMVEGTAQVLTSHYVETELGLEQPGLPALRVRALEAKTDLSSLRRLQKVLDTAEYDLAHFAVHILVEARGRETLFDFWRQLGNGMSWEQAFAASFGIGLEEYEVKVMELRKRPGNVQDLLAAENFSEALKAVPVPVKTFPMDQPWRFPDALKAPRRTSSGLLPSPQLKSFSGPRPEKSPTLYGHW